MPTAQPPMLARNNDHASTVRVRGCSCTVLSSTRSGLGCQQAWQVGGTGSLRPTGFVSPARTGHLAAARSCQSNTQGSVGVSLPPRRIHHRLGQQSLTLRGLWVPVLPAGAPPVWDQPADRLAWVSPTPGWAVTAEGGAVAGLTTGQPAPDHPLRASRRHPDRVPALGLRTDLPASCDRCETRSHYELAAESLVFLSGELKASVGDG
jgi:hypothetical protein